MSNETYTQFQQRARAGKVELTFTDEMRGFCERNALPPEDRFTLMHVSYRGNVPQTELDWWFIYRSIQLVLGNER